MKRYQLKNGLRVIVSKNFKECGVFFKIGKKGIVRQINTMDKERVGVDWGKGFDGNNLNNSIDTQTGFFVDIENLSPVNRTWKEIVENDI